jgi:cephalosporin-C deacetylase-like acetyl esterase
MRTCLLHSLLVALLSAMLLARISTAEEPAAPRKGTAHFEPALGEERLPERFRLAAHSFPFEQKPLASISKIMRISTVTFPSPMVTPHVNNNTVHCEYFCPASPGRKPGVIVLHILGGDFDLARLFARSLAGRGVAALFLKMPYYGERREPGIDARMISLDPEQTVRGMTQAALDIRQGAAWLASQEEVDPQQLGIMGISLGGITAALSASLEPRFTKVCLILAGGDMGEIAWNSTELAPLRKAWAESGRSKEDLFSTVKVVDPVTYARPVAGRKILMLNARQDEVVPPACTISLWHAFGEP